MKRNYLIFPWIWVFIYAGIIFYLSSQSHPLPDTIRKNFPDWILHGVEYGLFGFLIARAVKITFPIRSLIFRFFAPWILGTFYGLSDEWHQSFVPYRDSSASDLLVDAVGVALGIYGWMLFDKIKRKHAEIRNIRKNA